MTLLSSHDADIVASLDPNGFEIRIDRILQSGRLIRNDNGNGCLAFN